MTYITTSTIDNRLGQCESGFQLAWQYQLELDPSSILLVGLGDNPYSYLPFPIMITDEHKSQAVVTVVTDEISEFVQNVNGWIAYIRELLYSITGVESLYVTIDDKQVDIWILIPNRDIDLMRQIVEKEMLIVDSLNTDLELRFEVDFHIVYRYGSIDDRQLIPRLAIQIPR